MTNLTYEISDKIEDAAGETYVRDAAVLRDLLSQVAIVELEQRRTQAESLRGLAVVLVLEGGERVIAQIVQVTGWQKREPARWHVYIRWLDPDAGDERRRKVLLGDDLLVRSIFRRAEPEPEDLAAEEVEMENRPAPSWITQIEAYGDTDTIGAALAKLEELKDPDLAGGYPPGSAIMNVWDAEQSRRAAAIIAGEMLKSFVNRSRVILDEGAEVLDPAYIKIQTHDVPRVERLEQQLFKGEVTVGGRTYKGSGGVNLCVVKCMDMAMRWQARQPSEDARAAMSDEELMRLAVESGLAIERPEQSDSVVIDNYLSVGQYNNWRVAGVRRARDLNSTSSTDTYHKFLYQMIEGLASGQRIYAVTLRDFAGHEVVVDDVFNEDGILQFSIKDPLAGGHTQLSLSGLFERMDLGASVFEIPHRSLLDDVWDERRLPRLLRQLTHRFDTCETEGDFQAALTALEAQLGEREEQTSEKLVGDRVSLFRTVLIGRLFREFDTAAALELDDAPPTVDPQDIEAAKRQIEDRPARPAQVTRYGFERALERMTDQVIEVAGQKYKGPINATLFGCIEACRRWNGLDAWGLQELMEFAIPNGLAQVDREEEVAGEQVSILEPNLLTGAPDRWADVGLTDVKNLNDPHADNRYWLNYLYKIVDGLALGNHVYMVRLYGDSGHFVVLTDVTNNRYGEIEFTVMDPSNQIRSFTLQTLLYVLDYRGPIFEVPYTADNGSGS